MFAPPAPIQTRVFARLPDSLRRSGQASAWTAARSHRDVHSFLEGPSFDREGNLYCTDIPFGRIFRVSPDGQFTVVAEYDGEPNGLKIHRDGRLFVADHRRGLLAIDPASGRIETVLDRAYGEGFRGLNDLIFASNGDLYFTDQGQSGMQDLSGRLYRLRAGGELECVLDGMPSPNGLALSADESTVYVNLTRGNAVWKAPLDKHGRASKVGVFLHLNGGTGPDGLAVDESGNLAIAHPGMGSVWVFSARGEPLYRILSCAGERPTNLAFGGPDNRTLFITESESGSILCADLPAPGLRLYSHQ
ncbi:MAG TPA: SMP-30/gluconolactonase/LRE family protein [Bordetella sp.]